MKDDLDIDHINNIINSNKITDKIKAVTLYEYILIFNSTQI